ncbi:hypothetical protein C5F61_15880 [Photobacterium damselae subsp. damselae]|uniref:hypothetical protein n=1 Tax=Photobacterium damselae TaxID=38293 RepID=UPI000D071C4A|nr:hypothetical protein [Photobacterium damselae]PSB76500.1 hypothetical protein C5F61_15880 [Photobacterium damselae subsp. damselae]
MAHLYISELRLSSADVDNVDASIKFDKGVNIITGPSNTGKTFIFECLEYMLGRGALERRITESKVYSEIYLELCDTNGDTFTLKSGFGGENFEVFESSIDEINGASSSRELKRKHTAKAKNTLSYYLLERCGLTGTWIRSNKQGKKNELNLTSMRLLHLIDELRIPTKLSPFLSGQYTDETKEINVIKWLVSGEDDSHITEKLPVKVINNKAGKLELLEELISSLMERIPTGVTRTELEDQESKLELAIEEVESKHLAIISQCEVVESERASLNRQLLDHAEQRKELQKLSQNSAIVEKQYFSDLMRLQSTIEMGSAIQGIETRSCPVCDSVLNDLNRTVVEVCNSSKVEIEKTTCLINELRSAKSQFDDEIDELDSLDAGLEEELEMKKTELDGYVSNALKELSVKMRELEDKHKEVQHNIYLIEHIEGLQLQKDDIEQVIEDSSTSRQFEVPTVTMMESLANRIGEYLDLWGYPNVESSCVLYSEDDKDFVIAGESRNLAGKGYRSITYAACAISLLELYKGLGFMIIDSPLVTYKKPDVPEGEEISEDMASSFYDSLKRLDKSQQLIIIENEDVPKDVSEVVNHIHFTKNKRKGRYGFIPH